MKGYVSLRESVLAKIKERRERILSGKANSIPIPFKRFSQSFPGIEKGCFYVITSSTKGAKTQLSSYLFLYNSILYAYEHPEIVRVKVFYYNREDTKEEVIERFQSHLLFLLDNIEISPKCLTSSYNEPVPLHIVELLESERYISLVDFFENSIIFSDSSNPTGVWMECSKYARENGKFTKRTIERGGTKHEIEDTYIPNDPEEYKIIFYDHVGLVTTERGMNTKESIDKLSQYFMELRAKYGFTVVAIQQQAFAGENNESVKNNLVRPTIANLGDSKYTSRDANYVFGLFNPVKFNLTSYMGYNIDILKDNIRFLEIITSRHGSQGNIIALYFDGATCTFKELPRPEDKEALDKIYKYVLNKRKKKYTNSIFTMITKLIKKKKREKHGTDCSNYGK